ncbi:Smr/MutS family protein [Alteraurantiacibacter palmitatis]|uniref:Smr/MutS family protein n=1 Tax=Alteraurantiacibacter palmitatis TaxID=2054628 RepID=A0ABV7EBC2_9SPHN
MSRAPRGLSPEEADLWARLAATVKPLHPRKPAPHPLAPQPALAAPPAKRVKGRIPAPLVPAAPKPAPPVLPPPGEGLDSHWERRLARNAMEPDFTLDLHGHNLEQAHRRLDDGLVQAKAMGARLVLLITGKPRPVDAADRAEMRGAIRAKVLDWLAAGPHGSDIAAVRPAQRKHGGEGALYLVLRRRR